MSVLTIFQKIEKYIENIFEKGEDIAADAVKAFVKSLEAGGGPLLLQIALDAVSAVSTTNNTGSMKFGLARKEIIADLTARGLPILENAVQGAILVAVSKLKADVTEPVDGTEPIADAAEINAQATEAAAQAMDTDGTATHPSNN